MMQRYIKTIYDENGSQIGFIDGLESKNYIKVILLDNEKPYISKIFAFENKTDDELIEFVNE